MRHIWKDNSVKLSDLVHYFLGSPMAFLYSNVQGIPS